MVDEITLSDGTEISLNDGDINIFRAGDFEGESIPIKLWPELKEAIDSLINQAGRRN